MKKIAPLSALLGIEGLIRIIELIKYLIIYDIKKAGFNNKYSFDYYYKSVIWNYVDNI